jgi:hypothetical protein
MADATVIHFGSDDCDRVQALQAAGYEVRESISLDTLRRDIERDDVDAVIVSEAEPGATEKAAALVRQHTGAPLILFRRSQAALDESRFDRVFSWLIPAAHWLFETAVLVMQSKELRGQSEDLRSELEAMLAENRRQRVIAEAQRDVARGAVWTLVSDEDC